MVKGKMLFWKNYVIFFVTSILKKNPKSQIWLKSVHYLPKHPNYFQHPKLELLILFGCKAMNFIVSLFSNSIYPLAVSYLMRKILLPSTCYIFKIVQNYHPTIFSFYCVDLRQFFINYANKTINKVDVVNYTIYNILCNLRATYRKKMCV